MSCVARMLRPRSAGRGKLSRCPGPIITAFGSVVPPRGKVGKVGKAAVQPATSNSMGQSQTVDARMYPVPTAPLEQDDFSSNRHLALSFWWSMIFFRKPVSTPVQGRGRLFRDHALGNSRARTLLLGKEIAVRWNIQFPPAPTCKRRSAKGQQDADQHRRAEVVHRGNAAQRQQPE